jgi:hypothetical protein
MNILHMQYIDNALPKPYTCLKFKLDKYSETFSVLGLIIVEDVLDYFKESGNVDKNSDRRSTFEASDWCFVNY